MSRLDINFARRRRLPFVEVALLAIAGAVLMVQVRHWHELTIERDRVEVQIDALQHQVDKAARLRLQRQNEVSPKEALRRVESLKMQAALDYPWERLLSIIASPDIPGVALLSFSHDADARQVRLSLEAINMPALAKYVDELNTASVGEPALQWYISSYQRQVQASPPTIKAVVLTK